MGDRIGRDRVEALTREVGLGLFASMHAARPRPYQPRYWRESLMRLLMRDEALKLRAFRFIDVLPAIGDDPPELARHLKEYFANQAAPPATASATRRLKLESELAELDGGKRGDLRAWAARLTDVSSLHSPRAHLLAWAAWRGATRMSHSFIAGATIDEAVRAIRNMRRKGLAFTIDVLGEAALTPREAQVCQQTYLDLISELPRHAGAWPVDARIDEACGAALPRVNVSIKLSALHPGLDPLAPEHGKRTAKDRLRPLLRKAIEGGVHIHIDMEHFALKGLTLDIFKELLLEDEFRDYPHVGIVLQAYLKSGERDATELIDWAVRRGTPIWVRLVKGAYWDTETLHAQQRGWAAPVWEQKWETDACFERMTRLLLERHEHTRVAIASHNVRSLAHAIALKSLLHVPDDAFELQMLYGMGDEIKHAAVARGERCRVYTPFGRLLPGMAYLIRRLLENTANESFLRRSVDDHVPREWLLRDPNTLGEASTDRALPINLKFEFEAPIMDPFVNAADTNFTCDDERERLDEALSALREKLGGEYALRIGGKAVVTDNWIDSVNPSHPDERVARVAQADKPKACWGVTEARGALPSWRDTPPAERVRIVRAAAGLLRERRFEFAARLILECGQTRRDADAEVSRAVDFCEYYASEWIRMSEHPRRRDVPGERNEYGYAPRGVVAAISSASSALATPAGMISAALVTGNTVVFKPSSAAAGIGAELALLFESAGVLPGALSFTPGGGDEVGAALVAHPQVSVVVFAGSRRVGLGINALAVQSQADRPELKRVLLELGANNAVIIDTDADLDEAIKGVLISAFGAAGQKCSSASRCIILDAIYERFVERLAEAVAALTPLAAEDPACAVPPLVSRAALERLRAQIAAARQCAQCVVEVDVDEAVSSSGGYFAGPIVFAEPPADAPVLREDVTGPMLVLRRAKSIDHAVELFNDCRSAQSGAIYSRSPSAIDHARRNCVCGNFYINRPLTGEKVDLQPFGAFKLSGSGAPVGGPDYLIQFCAPRSVSENTLRSGFAPADPVAGVTG